LKLFQIEEPEGGPADPDGPGAAIGVDATSGCAEVAFSVGGNAALLKDREGFEQELPVPAVEAGIAAWQDLFEGARIRAERALARPVTHAVVVVPDGGNEAALREAADRAGLVILRLLISSELPASHSRVLAAAMLAEDMAPRPPLSAAPEPG
jgi:hypothetical protein